MTSVQPGRPRRARLTGAAATAGVVGLALATAACSPQMGGPIGTESAGEDVTVISQTTVAAWDPQRLANRENAVFAGRLWLRTLTTHPAAVKIDDQRELVADLATDTGRASDGARTWRFTLRDDVTWEDGSPVTCADLVHGVARGFDPALGGGSGYALAFLDIPKNPDGTSSYRGPFVTKARSNAAKAFAKAVSCKDRTITYRLSEPVGDFDEMVARPEFAPVKEARDRRQDGLHAVFSNGPYRLAGSWTPGQGGTFERNPAWSPDSDPVRSQAPLRYVYREGVAPEVVVSALADGDRGRRTLVIDPVPQVVVAQVGESAEGQVQVIENGSRVVDYLAPNHSRGPMKNARIRWAFALATDRAAYAQALGGDHVARPVDSLLIRVMPSRHDAVLPDRGSPDVSAARTSLRMAGEKGPVKVKVAYRSDPTMDTAMKALLPSWRKAGFAVTLEPLSADYFATIAGVRHGRTIDVFWSNWAADWPSASTVLPPLFDSRTNLSTHSAGRNYGRVEDPEVNRDFDRASALPRGARRASAWAQIDTAMLRRGTYVPLAQRRSTYLAGPSLNDLRVNQALGGVLDPARMEVLR